MTWTAIVLAAGHSRRMGEANKLTRQWRGLALLAHAVDAVAHAGAQPILVVTGHDREAVESVLSGHDVTFVHNPNHAEGMGASLRVGALAAPDQRVALCLGDMPTIQADTLRALARTPGDIVAPSYQGRRGHPVFFGTALLPELRELHGDRGARVLLQRSPDRLVLVPVEDPGVLLDIDTPDAWARLTSA